MKENKWGAMLKRKKVMGGLYVNSLSITDYTDVYGDSSAPTWDTTNTFTELDFVPGKHKKAWKSS